MLIVDAANVIGSRPTGWWRDRPGAARSFVARIRAAVASGSLDAPVLVVLEGRARDGAPEGADGEVEVVHAPASGDDTIVELAATLAHSGAATTVVTADRGLGRRVRAVRGAVVGPTWLLDRLPE